MNATIIIMEEFAYVPPECFFEVVVPLMMIKNTAMIGITTISGNTDNYVNDFIRRGVFEYVEITLVCDSCKKAGEVRDCPHKRSERPYWQDEDNVEKVKNIYGPDRVDQFARESLGILKQPTTACFDHESVLKLFTAPRESLQRVAEYLFCTIDPNGGSDHPENSISDFAVICHTVPEMKITGAEAFAYSDPLEYKERLLAHLARQFENPMVRNAKLVCAFEGNYANEAHYIKQLVLQHYPAAVFLTNYDNKDGVKTDEHIKPAMAMMMNIALRSDCVSIIKEFVTTEANPQDVLNKLRVQLLNYSRLTIPAKNAFEKTRFKYSGKGKNIKDKDDLAIAIQLAYYWSKRFFTTKEFVGFQRL